MKRVLYCAALLLSSLSLSAWAQAPQPIRINATDNPAIGTYCGSYSQAMVWSRRLTDTELQAIVADPYGWYSPRRSTVIVDSPYALPFGGGEMHGMGGIGGMY